MINAQQCFICELMKNNLKRIVRWLCIKLQVPITKNIEYDILTEKILKSVLKDSSNCVDVGAHKGEILDLLLKYAKHGHHIAFEPIPHLYENLQLKYAAEVKVYPYALSTFHGKTEFNLVLDDPAYSGIKKRKYKTENARISKIEVEVRTLDEVVGVLDSHIDLIKIDVEGGEFDVLKGATAVLKQHKPILIFECGKGASEFYGTHPEVIFEYLHQYGYNMHTLKGFTKNKEPLKKQDFVQLYEQEQEYYFVGE